jgi:CheY-like chemotaxis protein
MSELAGAAIGKPTPWSLPDTASSEEMLLAATGPGVKPSAPPGPIAPLEGVARELIAGKLIAVVARNRETRLALADAIESRGYRSLTLAEPIGPRGPQSPGPNVGAGANAGRGTSVAAGATAALWDTTPEAVSDPAVAARVLTLVDHAPVVALAGFPRVGNVARALAAGVSAVIAKPYLLDDLFSQIEQLGRRHSAAR